MGDSSIGGLGVCALIHGLQGGPQLGLKVVGRVGIFLPHCVPGAGQALDLRGESLATIIAIIIILLSELSHF